MWQNFARSAIDKSYLQKIGYLAIAWFPILASYALNKGVPIPHWGCPTLYWFGIPCPAWGLTRSFMAIARGEWVEAMDAHLLGPILFLGFGVAGVHLLVELFTGQRIRTFYTKIASQPKAQVFFFLMLMAYHVTRLHALGIWI